MTNASMKALMLQMLNRSATGNETTIILKYIFGVSGGGDSELSHMI